MDSFSAASPSARACGLKDHAHDLRCRRCKGVCSPRSCRDAGHITLHLTQRGGTMERSRIVAVLVVASVTAAACATAPADPHLDSPSASVKRALDWERLVALHNVGRLVHACRGGGLRPFRGLTRFTAASATLRARYVTSRGASRVRTLDPGEHLRAPGVGKKGSVRCFIRQATSPETTRLKILVDYTGSAVAAPTCR
jgi:hypothetical protein